MNLGLVERIVNAVLYEGYILYPYRPSAVKNRQRFNFGALCPESYSRAGRDTEAWSMQTQVLIAGSDSTRIDVKARFLHLVARDVAKPISDLKYHISDYRDEDFQVVESLEVGDQLYQTWQEAIERDVSATSINLSELAAKPRRLTFTFPAKREVEHLRDQTDKLAGVIVRKQEALEGAIELRIADCGLRIEETAIIQHLSNPQSAIRNPQLFKLTVRIFNLTPMEGADSKSRDEALMQSLLSTHTILSLQDGEFVSLLDTPDDLSEAAAACKNIGTWPVLVGEEGERDCMLSSPIILYDYPQIAPESAGDLFDGTEIDEILTLRIMTLTDEEKRAMRGIDERARQILERTETLPPEQLWKMHGAVRSLRKVEEEER